MPSPSPLPKIPMMPERGKTPIGSNDRDMMDERKADLRVREWDEVPALPVPRPETPTSLEVLAAILSGLALDPRRFEAHFALPRATREFQPSPRALPPPSFETETWWLPGMLGKQNIPPTTHREVVPPGSQTRYGWAGKEGVIQKVPPDDKARKIRSFLMKGRDA